MQFYDSCNQKSLRPSDHPIKLCSSSVMCSLFFLLLDLQQLLQTLLMIQFAKVKKDQDQIPRTAICITFATKEPMEWNTIIRGVMKDYSLIKLSSIVTGNTTTCNVMLRRPRRPKRGLAQDSHVRERDFFPTVSKEVFLESSKKGKDVLVLNILVIIAPSILKVR